MTQPQAQQGLVMTGSSIEQQIPASHPSFQRLEPKIVANNTRGDEDGVQTITKRRGTDTVDLSEPFYDVELHGQPLPVDAKARRTFCDQTAEESAASIQETYAAAVGEVEPQEKVKIVGQHFFGSTPVGSNFEVHSTGAMRSTEANSVRFDLIPQRMLERVATVMAKGAIKYGEYNWTKGFKWSTCFNHLARHSFLYLIGDKSEDHLAHMVCNLGFLIEFETTHPELNDIPSRKEK